MEFWRNTYIQSLVSDHGYTELRLKLLLLMSPNLNYCSSSIYNKMALLDLK